MEPRVNDVLNDEINDVMRCIHFGDDQLDEDAEFSYVDAMNVDSFGLSHYEQFGVDDLNLKLD